MKAKKGFSIAAVVVGLIAVALIGLTVVLNNNQGSKVDKFKEYGMTILEPMDENGSIADHVKGDKDAPVVIFEYADYQCPGCASINPRVNSTIEKADGKLAVVYRNYLLSYHQNATAAASAAEAAGLQGYFKAYADKLFSTQADWEYASASERAELFNKYFEEVTNKKGDLTKFNQDLGSEAISKKISFDMRIGKYINVPGTPAFFIDGQFIDWGNTKGGKIVVNGKTIEWDHNLTGEEFSKLLLDIVEAKTAE